MSFQSTFTSDNWHRDARSIAQRNGIRTRRWGMRVTVYLGGSAGDYVLSYGLASTNIQDNNNWLLVANIGATWGGGLTTADNGLTVTGTNVRLGGPLIMNTNISGGFDMRFGDGAPLKSFNVTTDENILLFGGGSVNILGNGLYVQSVGGDGISIDGVDQGSVSMSSDGGGVFIRDVDGGSILIQDSGQGGIVVESDGGGIVIKDLGTMGIPSLISLQGDNLTESFSGDISSDAAGVNTVSGDVLDLAANTYKLSGLTGSPGEFFAHDGTWAVPAGGGVSFGTVAQVPYMNATDDDFNYETGFEYDQANDRLSSNNIRLGSIAIAGNRILDFESSTGIATMTIMPGATSGGGARIQMALGQSQVKMASTLQFYNNSNLVSNLYVSFGLIDAGELGINTNYINAYGVGGALVTSNTLRVRGGDISGNTGPGTSTTGNVLITPGKSKGGSTERVDMGHVLINSETPVDGSAAGTFGNLSIFASTVTTVPNFQSGEKIIYIGNCVTAPLGNPTSGGYLYVEAGALVYRGSAGTVTTIANA